MGLSGNKRIQTLPPRLIERVIATRAASICRAVIQPHSIAFKPKSPNAKVEPRQAFPVMRPRCCLRFLTFLGINMAYSLPSSFPVSGLLSASDFSFQLGCGGAIGGKIGADVRAGISSGMACVTPVGP